MHGFTIYAVRPQAASILLAGTDPTGLQLYQVDPSGTFFKGQAFAIGQDSDKALDVIQNNYSPDMKVEHAVELSNRAIEHALNERPIVEHGIVDVEGGIFKKLKS